MKHTEEAKAKLRMHRLGKRLPPEQKVKVLAGLKKAMKANQDKMLNVRCLVTGKTWINRWDCINDLKINLPVFGQWIWKDRIIKGHHLQYVKDKTN